MFRAPSNRTRGEGACELTSSPGINASRAERGRVVELSLIEFARALGISVFALRKLVLRHLAVGSAEVVFDGLIFFKRCRRWRVLARGPWVRGECVLTWHSVDIAAVLLGTNANALRRKIERYARRERSGILVARWPGVVACKLSNTWKVYVESAEKDGGA